MEQSSRRVTPEDDTDMDFETGRPNQTGETGHVDKEEADDDDEPDPSAEYISNEDGSQDVSEEPISNEEDVVL